MEGRNDKIPAFKLTKLQYLKNNLTTKNLLKEFEQNSNISSGTAFNFSSSEVLLELTTFCEWLQEKKKEKERRKELFRKLIVDNLQD